MLFKINVKCQIEEEIPQIITIDPEAFNSSKNYAKYFEISFCDASGLNFKFLQGFNKLLNLSFYSISNVHLAAWDSFPILLEMHTLEITNSKGLDKWTQFPDAIKGLSYFELIGNEIGDAAMDRILQWILNSSPYAVFDLRHLKMKMSGLTRIPRLLSTFRNLENIYFEGNQLKNQTIGTSSLNFSQHYIFSLFLSSCGINNIEPRTFNGMHFQIVYHILMYLYILMLYKSCLVAKK